MNLEALSTDQLNELHQRARTALLTGHYERFGSYPLVERTLLAIRAERDRRATGTDSFGSATSNREVGDE